MFCIGCLAHNVPFIKLLGCSHVEYLSIYMQPEVKLQEHLICYDCHGMLKRIKKFKLQVEISSKVLRNNSSPTNRSKISLQIHKVIDIHIPEIENQAEEYNIQEKPLITENDLKLKNIETALKIINRDDGNMKMLTSTLSILATSNLSQITAAILGETSSVKVLPGQLNKKVLPKQNKIIKEVLPEQNKIDKEVLLEQNKINKGTDTIINNSVLLPSTTNIQLVKLSASELSTERSQLSTSPRFVNSTHRCHNCVLAFTYDENLLHHVDTRHTPKPDSVACDICSQYIHAAELPTHVERHFTRFECKTCSRRFNTLHEAERHYTIKHNRKRTIRCKLCGFTTRLKHKFCAHIMRLHSRFPCTRCRSIHKSLYELNLHNKLRHGKR